jgi:hypothetical protein
MGTVGLILGRAGRDSWLRCNAAGDCDLGKVVIGITHALALSGATDFSFVQEDDLWRGSEVHRIVNLAAKGTLDRSTVPKELCGYLASRDAFVRETGYITLKTEERVQNKSLGLRGRIDDFGLMHGRKTLVEYKTGAIQPAVALQLALGGHLLDPSVWFGRYAVQLKADGSYSMKHFGLMEWPADLSTALACCRVAAWKMKQGMNGVGR